MEKIKVITDTASDIEPEAAKRLKIDMLPLTIHYQGKSYREAYDLSKDKFFAMLNTCNELPTTAQVTPAQFLEAYEKAMKKGFTHVVQVCLNGSGSGTYNSACLARAMFEETYGKDKLIFEILDSHTYSLCYGRPVLLAAEMVQAGKSFLEVVSFLKQRLDTIHAYAYMSTLKFAQKSGRISVTAAIIGEALGLKPIMYVGNGGVEVYSKCRGEKSAITTLIESVKENAVDLENQEIILVIGDVSEAVKERLRKEVQEKLNPAAVFEGKLGCCIANNAGPQTCGILFSGKKLNLYE